MVGGSLRVLRLLPPIKLVAMIFRTRGERANHYTTDAVQLCIRYSTVETKEATRIGYNGFVVQNEFSFEDRGAINSTKKMHQNWRKNRNSIYLPNILIFLISVPL